MKKFLIVFFVTILLYHILHTALVYGRGGIDNFFVAGIKDLLWIVLILGALGTLWTVEGFSAVRKVLFSHKALVVLLFLLGIGSIIYTSGIGIGMKSMIIGFKYDIRPLLVIISAIVVGSVLYALSKRDFSTFLTQPVERAVLIKNIVKLIVVICVVGLLWQGAKILLPEFFYRLGYGPVGDYILGGSPPIWYRTGPGGMMRLQGIFSGPNNYGYFLVGVFPVVLLYCMGGLKQFFVEKSIGVRGLLHYTIPVAIVFLSTVGTLSRAAFLAVFFQGVLFLRFQFKHWRWYLVGGLLSAIGAVALFSFGSIKQGSTDSRLEARSASMQAIGENPMGYGLGSAGPAIHYQGVFLPENQYLQIILDIGLLGFLVRAVLWCLIVYAAWRCYKKSSAGATVMQFLLVVIVLGVLGLGSIGLFLHVLEDSMVNYLVLGLYGIILGAILSHHDAHPGSVSRLSTDK